MPEAPSRNAPCPCGSGKRFKHCCGAQSPAAPAASGPRPAPPAQPADPCNLWLAEAINGVNRGDFAQAATLCDRVLASAGLTDLQKLAAAEIGGAAATHMARHERARELYLVALAVDPARVQTLHNLGLNAVRLMNLEDAVGYWRKVLALDSAHVAAYTELGEALRKLARWDEAKALYEHAIAAGHVDQLLCTGHLMSLHYNPRDPDESFRAHLDWAARFAPAANMAGRVHRNERSTSRKLRVGYYSPNFSRNVVGHFFKPLLAHHDRARFELYLYSHTEAEDDFTAWFRRSCDEWTDVRNLAPRQAAALIAADRIDVMVDLAGLAARSILPALSYKPAPVQLTMLDYFDTTGVAAIDYFVSDDYHSPADSPQRFTETLIRLPTIRLCYEPVDIAPPVRELPALRNGFVTFGSFNRRQKVTPEVVALWSRVLHAVPDARLLLKGGYFDRPEVQERIVHEFADAGISPARLEFRGHSAHRAALEQYGDVDIALDTFPWNGGLTTCEALLMGVPVVALKGDRILSRQSAAMMHAVGLDDFVADDAEQYVDIARRRAQDLQALALLRGGLRKRLQASPLCDGKRYAQALEEVYTRIWAQWCAQEQRAG